jgi:poly(A) polymerase
MRDSEQGAVRLSDAHWLNSDEAQAIFAAIASGGFEARAVGGAVRNALLNEAVKDVDFATTATPEDVMRLTEQAGLRPVPTGLEHGTITVVVNHTPFEVTTLRRDIETFGRHARVTYTTDWAEDAQRRDFTINALYCDSTGLIHDPLGGLPDIRNRQVRFIGNAADRIREDYLRILRFFRFTAQYANGVPNAESLSACRALKGGLKQLSGERIRAELLRLLIAKAAAKIVVLMDEADILSELFGAECHSGSLARTIEIETALQRPADSLLRLGALTLTGPGAALQLKERLKLSSQEYDRLAGMALNDPAFDPGRPENEARAFIYRHGAERFEDGMIFTWARSDAPISDKDRRDRLALASTFKPPELPVRGSDVLALGVPPGPDVGRIISGFEEWWIANDFPGDPALLAAELRRRALVTKS